MLSRTNLPYSSRRSTPNPRPFKSLQPLCRSQKSQLLWNQANPASFAKTPGVGVPRKNRPMESATYSLFSPDLFLTWLTPCFAGSVSRCLCGNRDFSATFSRHLFTPVLEGSLATRHFPLSTFRINTCKSATKQTTLTISRINTYAKTRGGGPRLHALTPVDPIPLTTRLLRSSRGHSFTPIFEGPHSPLVTRHFHRRPLVTGHFHRSRSGIPCIVLNGGGVPIWLGC